MSVRHEPGATLAGETSRRWVHERGCRCYLTGSGAATEPAAVSDIRSRLGLSDPERHRRGKELLNLVVGMLVKLATALETASTQPPPSGAGAGAEEAVGDHP